MTWYHLECIWMEVGDHDLLNPNILRDGLHDGVLANEKMAAAFAARGYQYQFVFARNAGHVDHAVKAQTLHEALGIYGKATPAIEAKHQSCTQHFAVIPQGNLRLRLPLLVLARVQRLCF